MSVATVWCAVVATGVLSRWWWRHGRSAAARVRVVPARETPRREGHVRRRSSGRGGSVLAWGVAVADQLELDGDPVRALIRWAVGALGGAVLAGWRWGVAGALVALGSSVAVPAVLVAWRRREATRRFALALPGVLEGVAGRLRAGASLAEAVAGASEAPTGSRLLDEDLLRLRRRLAHGQPFVAAVRSWEDDRPMAATRLVAAALVLGAEAGGARARAIDGVAATLRDRLALSREVHALSTQARASAFVMMGAPVVFAALGLLGDPAVSAFLLRTPAGLACLCAGLLLDGVAGLWMVRIARSAT